jgi:sulfur transfer protein SufE
MRTIFVCDTPPKSLNTIDYQTVLKYNIPMDKEFLIELSHEDFYEVMLDYDYNDPPENLRLHENKVVGCATDVWIALIDGEIYHDSSGLFVKGILTAMIDDLKSTNYAGIKDIELSDFQYVTPARISMRRMRGFDMALKKIKELLAV